MSGENVAAEAPPARKKKKRKKKRYLLKMTICAALAAGVYMLMTSALFDIQAISVENNEHYTSAQIIDMSGVHVGDNAFQVSMGDVKRRLVQDPYIRGVKTRRQLPSTLVIHVSEREEAAFLRHGGQFVIIDEDGLALSVVGVEPLLTELASLTVTGAEAGQAVAVEQNAAFADTLSLMKEAKKNELYFKKINISNIIIRAYVYDHLICEGAPAYFFENMTSLKNVLMDIEAKGLKRGTVKLGGDGYIAFQPLAE
jgi:cell division protein FtsQ